MCNGLIVGAVTNLPAISRMVSKRYGGRPADRVELHDEQQPDDKRAHRQLLGGRMVGPPRGLFGLPELVAVVGRPDSVLCGEARTKAGHDLGRGHGGLELRRDGHRVEPVEALDGGGSQATDGLATSSSGTATPVARGIDVHAVELPSRGRGAPAMTAV